ncbi:MAG: prepilin-type N-terminal cleavage/methylation domain-containing protein [Sedimentisphaerales bacterium]|nr:prepilin-type N-terminal cleavage/methylation domain-containing protein [Sedimentisphaerales bacterium]
MKNRRGFTLVELMVVVLIVGILAAVAIPIMRGRIDSAKWTEGKAMAGTIATALRAWGAEHGADYLDYGAGKPDLGEMGFIQGAGGDLDGTYFDQSNYTWTTAYDVATNRLTFTIRVDKGTGITGPDWWELKEDGSWTSPDVLNP